MITSPICRTICTRWNHTAPHTDAQTNIEINFAIGYKSVSQQQFIQFVLLYNNLASVKFYDAARILIRNYNLQEIAGTSVPLAVSSSTRYLWSLPREQRS